MPVDPFARDTRSAAGSGAAAAVGIAGPGG